MSFKIKRVYEAPKTSDGIRVLVDRLWPRGLKKADVELDHWMKDVAPSPALRQWFGHDPDRFTDFKRRYTAELKSNPALAELRQLGTRRVVTLLYGAKDPEINHAVVLLSTLRQVRLMISRQRARFRS
jgi:uncharacterized protein YeaO (DUF488 family)